MWGLRAASFLRRALVREPIQEEFLITDGRVLTVDKKHRRGES